MLVHIYETTRLSAFVYIYWFILSCFYHWLGVTRYDSTLCI